MAVSFDIRITMTISTRTFCLNPEADADESNLHPLWLVSSWKHFSCAEPENFQLFDSKHQNLGVRGSKRHTGSFSRKLQMLLPPTIGRSVWRSRRLLWLWLVHPLNARFFSLHFNSTQYLHDYRILELVQTNVGDLHAIRHIYVIYGSLFPLETDVFAFYIVTPCAQNNDVASVRGLTGVLYSEAIYECTIGTVSHVRSR